MSDDKRKLVQAKDFFISGGGIGLTDTSITIDDFTLPNSGQDIVTAMFGDLGTLTLEPETDREENISFTTVTQNGDGTATLTGVVRGLPLASTAAQADYNTPDLSLRQAHSGGSRCRITNSVTLLQWFASTQNQELIENLWVFPDTTADGRPQNETSQPALLAQELITMGEVTSLITSTVIPPIVVSSSSATTGLLTAGSLTWAHTHTGTNGLLTVQVVAQEDQTITGITYNGDALTQQISETRVVGNLRTEIWTRVNPDLGTNNIVVTMSAAALITGSALSFNNVNQATPIGDTNSADGSSVTPSTSITTTQINSVIVDSAGTANDPIVFTAGAGQSIQEEISSAATRQIATSIESAPTVAAYTMDYTISPSTNWTIASVEVLGLGVPGIAGVTQIVAGTNVTVSPVGGTGVVTVNSQEMEVQESGVPIETDTDTWNFTGSVNVTNPSPGVVDIDIIAGNTTTSVTAIDDFTNLEHIEEGGGSYLASGNFATLDTLATTEQNHPGIVHQGFTSSRALTGFMTQESTVLGNSGLLSFDNDFDITIMSRLVYSGSPWTAQYRLDGPSDSVTVEITDAQVQYDIGGGVVVTAVPIPTSNTWFTLRFQYISGTLTITLDASTVFAGAVALTGSFYQLHDVVATGGGATLSQEFDYITTNYTVTR